MSPKKDTRCSNNPDGRLHVWLWTGEGSIVECRYCPAERAIPSPDRLREIIARTRRIRPEVVDNASLVPLATEVVVRSGLCPKSKDGRHRYRHLEGNRVECIYCGWKRSVKNAAYLERIKSRG